jgi:hypothetical protein
MQCNATCFKENIKLPLQSNKVQRFKENKKLAFHISKAQDLQEKKKTIIIEHQKVSSLGREKIVIA